MKLNQLSTSELGKNFLLEKSLNDIDNSAREELDGKDPLESELSGEAELEAGLDTDLDPEPDKTIKKEKNVSVDLDAPSPDELQTNSQNQEYDLNHVTSQLNGMIERWFSLAQGIDPSKKEPFLKLGDRLSEIIEVIESEFTNAQ